MKKTKNYNCDNDYCVIANGEIRTLPTGGGENALLCKACFEHEMRWRHSRNKELSYDCRFDIPKWESLKVYNPGE